LINTDGVAVYAVASSALDVSLDAVGKLVRRECCADRDGIDRRLGRSALQTRWFEVVLMLEQAVVHDPKRVGTSQRIYRFGRFGGHLRARMDVA
jgi:hypothetical protein